MKTNKQKANWIIDAVLFTGFLLSFLLDLTGLSLHQWLGILVGMIAGYHSLVHWDWVKSVTLRLFKRTSRQARAFYLLDASLMLGLFLTIMNGLVISTWLALPLKNYPTWRNFHVTVSIVTLLLVVLKIGLHWRWIVSVTKRYIFTPTAPAGNAQPLQPVPAPVTVDRREFLKLMGIVGAMAALAIGSALNSTIAALTNEPALAELSPATPTSVPSPQPAVRSESPTQAPSPTPTVQINSTASKTTSTCVVRCNKGCSYPGRCSRYTDANRNNRCDLGECM